MTDTDNKRIEQREQLAATLTVAWANVTEDLGPLAKTVVFDTYRDLLGRLERLDAGLEDIDERVV